MSKPQALRWALLGLASIWLTGYAMADNSRSVSINAGDLDVALESLGKQYGVDVIYDSRQVRGLKTPGLSGTYDVEDAFRKVLQGTALVVKKDSSGVILISVRTNLTGQRPGDSPRTEAAEGQYRLAQADSPAAAASGAPSAAPVELEEITVTAQKRSERLLEVPVPVTAISGDTLVSGGQRHLEDYYNKVPGLSLTMVDDGFTSVAIRGVTAGGIGSSPTVGTVIDDIPFGASFVVNGFQESVSDFDPSELQRVEVLRGPQGTLYGASSMGGLIKYVTVDPSTTALGGQIRLGANGVSHGSAGYDVLGSVNVPLTDTLAMRVSGSARRDPGYVDNIFTGQDNVNKLDSETARWVGFWKPDEDFSVKVSALYQHTHRYGSSEVDLPARAGFVSPGSALGGCAVPQGLEQCDLRDTGWQRQEFDAYSAIINKHWGAAQLTSLTGYSIKKISNLQDYTPALGPLAAAFFGVGGFVIGGPERMTKLSQEIRFSTPLGSRVDWMLGLFYTRETGHTPYRFQAVDPSTVQPAAVSQGGLPGGLAYEGDDPQGYKEYAAFTDVTFKLTDQFDVQIGARESHNQLYYSNSSDGVFNGLLGQSFYHSQSQLTSTDNPFTYLLSPRYKLSPDLMVYARLASGYRPGGFNINPTIRAQGHPTFTHDTTQSYELGAKGTAFERLLSFDTSVYYIDWKDIQLQLVDPNDVTVKYTLNAGKAKSEGVELALTLAPVKGLEFSAWADFNEAELTSVPPNSLLTARPGDRLPYSARWTGGLSLDQKFTFTGSLTGFVGASLTYVGDRMGQFVQGSAQGTFPSYVQADMRGGVAFNQWRVDTFIDNLADRRGVLRNGNDSLMSLPYRVTYIRPRSYGISVTRSF